MFNTMYSDLYFQNDNNYIKSEYIAKHENIEHFKTQNNKYHWYKSISCFLFFASSQTLERNKHRTESERENKHI